MSPAHLRVRRTRSGRKGAKTGANGGDYSASGNCSTRGTVPRSGWDETPTSVQECTKMSAQFCNIPCKFLTDGTAGLARSSHPKTRPPLEVVCHAIDVIEDASA